MSCVVKLVVLAFLAITVINAAPNKENENIPIEHAKSNEATEDQLRYKRTPSGGGGGGVDIDNFHIHNVTGGEINLGGAGDCKVDVHYGEPTQRNKLTKKFSLSFDKVNFFQAFLNCKVAGMELAAIENEKESKALDTYLDRYKVDGYENSFWLSGTHLNNVASLQYYWLTTGKPVVYANWTPLDPNNYNGVQHCMTWTLIQGITGWVDIECEGMHKYVCEYRD